MVITDNLDKKVYIARIFNQVRVCLLIKKTLTKNEHFTVTQTAFVKEQGISSRSNCKAVVATFEVFSS